MKLSSTIIFVPLTTALPALPSAIYTNDQLTTIIAPPNAPDYNPTETPAAKVTTDHPATAVIDAKIPDKSLANREVTERDVISTTEKDTVATVADDTPNVQYPGAAEIEAREAEESTRVVPVVKLPVGKRAVWYLEKRVKTNPFCPKLYFS
ncbi:hypothetical protein E2P81_ATG03627 [Venturia nashicola]|nr:hypothetical protein E2P81_ATG03627 [Venturia nashicola]